MKLFEQRELCPRPAVDLERDAPSMLKALIMIRLELRRAGAFTGKGEIEKHLDIITRILGENA